MRSMEYSEVHIIKKTKLIYVWQISLVISGCSRIKSMMLKATAHYVLTTPLLVKVYQIKEKNSNRFSFVLLGQMNENVQKLKLKNGKNMTKTQNG